MILMIILESLKYILVHFSLLLKTKNKKKYIPEL